MAAAKQEVRKGLAAIKEATERKGGTGEFKPFCPEIRWAKGEEKNLLILSDLEELQEFKIHEWVKVGEHTNNDGDVKPDYGFFISRTDPSIGEANDDLESRLGNQPRLRFLGVAVEVIPITETQPGRGGKTNEVVVGFEVATDSYTAKDDDDEEIEVEYPCMGVISLSASNFWGWLGNYAEKHDVNGTVMNVTRQGDDKDTRYDFIPVVGNDEIDLSAVVELAEGISYIRETDDFGDVIEEAANIEDTIEAAQVIADYLLATRIAEMSDGENYHKLVSAINELPPSKWGKKRNAKGAGKATAKKSSRATRSTSRASSRTKVNDAEPETAPVEAADAPEGGEDDGFSKLRQRARARAKAADAATE